jgi:hypothetical protein
MCVTLHTGKDLSLLDSGILKSSVLQVFFGLSDPMPDPLVAGTDPDPDPSTIKQNRKKNLYFNCFVSSL